MLKAVKKKEIESAIASHDDWISHLGATMDRLGRRMDDLAAAQERTQAQIEATNKSLKELGEATDKRIGDLVGAIGKLLEARNGNPQ